MPRLRLSRLLPAILLLAAIFLAFRENVFVSAVLKLVPPVQQHLQHTTQSVFSSENTPQYSRRIVAVGDLHGDYENALKVLQMADVVDKSGNWSGKVDLFVQTGDIIDRGVDTIKLFLWMEQLRSQARAAGGDVISHLGNHEWMNLLADWRYVYPKEIATFGSVAARQKMLQTGRIGRAWAANYSVTSRVALHPPMGPLSPFPSSVSYNPSLGHSSIDFVPIESKADGKVNIEEDPLADATLSFVHGGLSPSYAHLTPYPSSINDIGRTLLRRLQTRVFPPPHPPAPYAGLPTDATDAEKGLYADDGPLWYRGWALKSENEVCGEVDDVLTRTGVRRLVMGHTPNFEHITSRCGGKVIIIDTGISHAYGGTLSALSIQYILSPSEPSPGDKAQRKWSEREVITAIYPDHQDVLVVEERELMGS
ncbi:Metallo-dependent phosphatase [Fomitiporia mediterranea MF3/22]|uniref:Metallo-dependent phosphatase n=1 Tax=Fomitiporia mediterranea (strain MF3/22) TaxID=694068 RepID=UPI0004407B43|nr:Metallo-dependent phosphatase [Fomitiporia mediterranea MF3/22]EJD06841.1 Metallo-dependent phosphatase [Fomitiporia mediterranea MF3/22]